MNTNNWPWSAAADDSPKAADFPRYMDQAGRKPTRLACHTRVDGAEGFHAADSDRRGVRSLSHGLRAVRSALAGKLTIGCLRSTRTRLPSPLRSSCCAAGTIVGAWIRRRPRWLYSGARRCGRWRRRGRKSRIYQSGTTLPNGRPMRRSWPRSPRRHSGWRKTSAAARCRGVKSTASNATMVRSHRCSTTRSPVSRCFYVRAMGLARGVRGEALSGYKTLLRHAR